MGWFRKPVWTQVYRGFESPPLRHFLRPRSSAPEFSTAHGPLARESVAWGYPGGIGAFAGRNAVRPTRAGGERQAPRAQGAARLWLLRSRPDQVHVAPLLGTRRTPPARAGRPTRFGGEGGIRTPGGLLTRTRFPSELLKPLGHLSTKSACSPVKAPGRLVGAAFIKESGELFQRLSGTLVGWRPN